MTDLRKAAEMALEALEMFCEHGAILRPLETKEALRQALAQTVDAVPGFTAAEPRQSLSRMKPGDRFILVRTSEIYQIKQDGSQWNETRQRPARLHKNSQVRLIVTHPKCDDACMNICTEGFTKPPTCKTSVDAVNTSQERVDETAKGEHEPVAYLDEGLGAFYWPNDYEKNVGFTPLYAVPPHRWSNVTDEALMQEVRRRGFVIRDAQIEREWVGLTYEEFDEINQSGEVVEDIINWVSAKLKEKNT